MAKFALVLVVTVLNVAYAYAGHGHGHGGLGGIGGGLGGGIGGIGGGIGNGIGVGGGGLVGGGGIGGGGGGGAGGGGGGYGGGDGHGWGWEPYTKPSYKFAYGVNDGWTKDQKTAAEWRDGDNVQGHYALREPDGGWRTVTYWADKHGGFRANVHRTPNKHHH